MPRVEQFTLLTTEATCIRANVRVHLWTAGVARDFNNRLLTAQRLTLRHLQNAPLVRYPEWS